MNDLFSYSAEQEQTPPQQQVLSVSDVSAAIKAAVEGAVGKVAVAGEISGFRPAASGHLYFNLKDENNVLKAIVWRSTASRLAVDVKEGMQVIAHGKLTTYSARSEYQIIIDRLEEQGVGALMQRFEELKARLHAEGLFDEAVKKPIPFVPQRIGIITSPTGSVIEDMLHRIGERFPSHIMLHPVLVQGPGAKEQVAAAIAAFNRMDEAKRPDVLIVARGGGSLEDLWAFNEEIVVRAVAASDIPVISGVGHEPDVTLCDFAADKRAPTPSAAAEMVVPVREDLVYTVATLRHRLAGAIKNRLGERRRAVELLWRQLPDLRSRLTQARLRLDDRQERLTLAMQRNLQTKRHKLESLKQLHHSYSPKAPLKRGFVYMSDANGEMIRSAKTKATDVQVHFHDGERKALLQ